VKQVRTRNVSALCLILLMTFSALMISLPAASAHDPPWTIPTFAYIVATPDRVGVGQTSILAFWLNWVPPGAGGIGGDRWRNLTVDVTKPDGSQETLGPFTSDPIGGSYTQYTPTQTGTYTFTFKFQGQVPSLTGPTGIPSVNPSLWDYLNDTFLPSSATTTLTVQQEQLQTIPDYPLPTNYWTRPIEGQNTEWAKIGSNWLALEPGDTYYQTQPYGIAPESAHVMWVKPLQDGGITGGTYPGEAYYAGDSYEMRFNNPIIIHGRLYYDLPLGSAKTGGGYLCVDLRTGEEIWWANWTSALPSFGQIYDYESINQHGVLPNGLLWRVSGRTWNAYDSLTGSWLYTLTNVPSGNTMVGETGELVRYVTNNNNNWLALWNNTAAHDLTRSTDPTDFTSTNYFQWYPVGKTVDASGTDSYSWNVSLPAAIPSDASIYKAFPGDLVLFNTPVQFFGGNAAFGTNPYTMYAVSLKPETMGQLLWTKDYAPPPNNVTRFLSVADPETRVFTTLDKETYEWTGFSMDNGNQLWGPTKAPDMRDFTYYSSRSGAGGSSIAMYQGKIYHAGFMGIVYVYDIAHGDLLWTYGNGGEGNSTFSGLNNVWGYYNTFIGAFADGKLYTFTQEHSVNTPIYKGATIRCVNATTGEEIWTLPGFASSTSFYSRIGPIADGYLSFFNAYDGQVYTIGKGPSSLTVTTPQNAVPSGVPVVIQGTVSDQSAGAKRKVESGEFSMVPAMSDQSMSGWMQYIYMQKPKPTDAVGVNVHLTATDPNGNYQDIGTATSDSLGNFAITWTPPVSGMYTVNAKFEGTNSYFGSEAGSSFVVYAATAASPQATQTPPPTQTTTPTQTTPPPTQSTSPTVSPSQAPEPTGGIPATTYIIIVAAIVIIVVVAAATVLLRRRK
jgi:hypothetical protein